LQIKKFSQLSTDFLPNYKSSDIMDAYTNYKGFWYGRLKNVYLLILYHINY